MVLSSSLFGLRHGPAFATSASFALLVVGPPNLRRHDVLLLAAFRSSGQQYHQPIAVPSEVDAISWPEIDPEFLYPNSNTLNVRKVAKPDASKRDRDLGRGLSVEAIKPVPVRAIPAVSRYSRICTHIWYHIRYYVASLDRPGWLESRSRRSKTVRKQERRQ
jgi:hypothetical protein